MMNSRYPRSRRSVRRTNISSAFSHEICSTIAMRRKIAMVRGSVSRNSSAWGTISDLSPWRTTWMPREAQNREWSWIASSPQIVCSALRPHEPSAPEASSLGMASTRVMDEHYRPNNRRGSGIGTDMRCDGAGHGPDRGEGLEISDRAAVLCGYRPDRLADRPLEVVRLGPVKDHTHDVGPD